MSDPEIDAAVLSVAEPSWRKVALIVSRVARQMGSEFAAREHTYRRVAGRVSRLVADGRLAAQGDLSRWRHSEVRLP